TETLNFIAIGGSESSSLTLTIPDSAPLNFALTFVVDDIGDGTGIVVELDETNNSATANFTLIVSPEVLQMPDLISCNEGFGNGTFDFSGYAESLKINPADIVTFHLSQIDAEQGINPISNTSSFLSTSNPQQIYVRLDNGVCPATGSFLLRTRICPPETYNYVTPNNDGINDTFFVKGLRNIFLNFKMSIYNRWGSLVWTGDHSKPDWDGIASEEKVGSKETTVPVGTYYFVLELNEPDYPKPIVGWVYVTK
ncbi:MAG: gliding motility-associated C-terminal domain-containing protein, partial [Flavobacterium sp.]